MSRTLWRRRMSFAGFGAPIRLLSQFLAASLTPSLQRENMIFTLQGQIRDLESGLAHVLKEKENEASGENKSMVDLTAWLSPGSDCLVTFQ